MADVSVLSDGVNTYDIKDATARSDISTLDGNVVKLTGDQTVGGVKQFTSGVIDLFGTDAVNYRGHFNIDKGSNPITTYYGEITFQDKVDGNDSSHRLGTFSTNVASDGWVLSRMVAYRNTAGSSSGATISVSMKNDGTINTYAPACDNNDCIITQQGLSTGSNGYVKLGNGIMIQWGRVASGSGNQTITFPQAWYNTDYALACTTTPGNSTTKAAISVDSSSRTKTTVSVNIESNASSNWIGIGTYK